MGVTAFIARILSNLSVATEQHFMARNNCWPQVGDFINVQSKFMCQQVDQIPGVVEHLGRFSERLVHGKYPPPKHEMLVA